MEEWFKRQVLTVCGAQIANRAHHVGENRDCGEHRDHGEEGGVRHGSLEVMTNILTARRTKERAYSSASLCTARSIASRTSSGSELKNPANMSTHVKMLE